MTHPLAPTHRISSREEFERKWASNKHRNEAMKPLAWTWFYAGRVFGERECRERMEHKAKMRRENGL